MQATITYMLTEQAQRAAIAATGQPVARKQTTTIDVDPADLAAGIWPIGADGSIYVDATRRNDQMGIPDGGMEFDSIPDLPAIARAARAKDDAYQATVIAADKGMAAWLDAITDYSLYRGFSNTRERLASAALRGAGIEPRYVYHTLSTPIPPATAAALDRVLQRIATAESAEREAAKREAEAKARSEATKEQAKQDFIAAWIAANAEPLARQQFEDGLMERSQAITLIADAELAKLGLGKYDPPICENRGCRCGREDIATVPTAVYPALRELRDSLPEGAILQPEKVRECLRDEEGFAQEEEASEPVHAVNIKVPVGPFLFQRLVRLDR